MRHRTICNSAQVLSLMLTLGGAACSADWEQGSEQQPTAKQNTPLYVDRAWLWASPNIPVCFEDTATYASEKQWVRNIVTTTWQMESNVTFTGWGNCPPTVEGTTARIKFQDAGGESKLGKNTAFFVSGIKVNTWESGVCVEGWTRRRCVEATAVHEFGHALSFLHENEQPTGTPDWCRAWYPKINATGTAIGAWDQESVMNYCSTVRQNDAHLTGTDIFGVGATYGFALPMSAPGLPTPTAVFGTVFSRGDDGRLLTRSKSVTTSQNITLTSAPVAVIPEAGTVIYFARSEAGTLMTAKTVFGTWSAWSDLGVAMLGRPTAVRRGNEVDVFVRELDGTIGHVTWTNSGFTIWVNLGGNVAGEIAAASWGSDRTDIVVRDRGGALKHRFWAGSNGFSAWTTLGGLASSDPSLVSWGVNRLDLAYRGSSGGAWHRSYDGTAWSAERSLGGATLGSPHLVAFETGSLAVYVRLSDNAVYEKTWTGSGFSASWYALGGDAVNGLETLSSKPNWLEIFAVGSDKVLRRRFWNGVVGWAAWEPWGVPH